MKNKPQVGQKLYSLNIGNAARGRKQELTPVIVTAVGRKYFTCLPEGSNSKWLSTQYNLDTWYEKTNYSFNSSLYESKQEFIDEKESEEICRYFEGVFKYGKNNAKLGLEDLRKIKAFV